MGKGFQNRTVLFRSGQLIFMTYGLWVGSAFALGTLAASYFFFQAGGDAQEFLWFSMLILLPAVLLGARAFSILLEWRKLFIRPTQTLLKPGYMLHGGVAGGAAAIIGYSIVEGAAILPLLDAWAFALPLGEAVARIGCFVYGCCWGKPSNGKAGVCYHNLEAKVLRFKPHLRGVKIHPVQLYGTAAHGVQFLVFVLVAPYLAQNGTMLALYLLTHPIIRVALERFREDDRGKLFGRFTHTNLYSTIQFAIGLALLATAPFVADSLVFSHALPSAALASSPSTSAYLATVFLAASAAFGVHFGSVGAWIPPQLSWRPVAEDLASFSPAIRPPFV